MSRPHTNQTPSSKAKAELRGIVETTHSALLRRLEEHGFRVNKVRTLVAKGAPAADIKSAMGLLLNDFLIFAEYMGELKTAEGLLDTVWAQRGVGERLEAAV